MALNFYKPLSSVTHLLVKSEQRAVAFSFIAASILLVSSYLPDMAAFVQSLLSSHSAAQPPLGPDKWLWFKAHWQDGARSAAHFLFSASAMLAVVLAYLRLGGATLDDLRVRFTFRDHTIICGMSNRSKILALDILAQDRSVVIIDVQEKRQETMEQRMKGICVVQGDAADPEVLAQAGLAHARNVICLTDRDETNISILEAVRVSFEQRDKDRQIECFCHIQNPNLYAHLEQLPLMGSKREGVRFRLFNTEGITAAELLRRFPPERHVPLKQQENGVHVVLIGGGNFAVALAVQMAEQCHYWREQIGGAEFSPARLTIVDAQAESILQSLRWLCPAIDRLLELGSLPIAPESPDALNRLLAAGGSPISQFYVSLANEISTLAVATRLAQAADAANPAARRSIVAVTPARLHRIDPVAWNHSAATDVMESYESCQDEVIIGGVRDLMARVAHERYLRTALGQGRQMETRPALYPWEHLSEFLRDSNRQQVAHIATKLRVLGWEIVANPTEEERVANPVIPDERLEQLADMEHRRWMAFHLMRGWIYAPVRNDTNREHDCLVAYADLSDDIKEYDREAVRNMAAICHEAGFGLRRAR